METLLAPSRHGGGGLGGDVVLLDRLRDLLDRRVAHEIDDVDYRRELHLMLHLHRAHPPT
ncbi:MAG TPA: hypothetical protein VGH94_01765 [Acidimicrobiales bacterium]|jgi:hypothetical protein